MAGLASIGLKVKYSDTVIANTKAGVQGEGVTELLNCFACPSLGGDTEQIDVTCFQDTVKKNIPGLKDYGSLEFSFLYDAQEATSSFNDMKDNEGSVVYFAVELPAKTGYSFGGAFVFSAIPTVDMDEVAVNDKITWTLSLALQSEIQWAAPVSA